MENDEREWSLKIMNEVVMDIFSCNEEVVAQPILFSAYLSKTYDECHRQDLRNLIKLKLKIFSDEEVNVQLVIFDQVVDHIVRIDRVLRQPLGHLLLVGASGAGKTIVTKFEKAELLLF